MVESTVFNNFVAQREALAEERGEIHTSQDMLLRVIKARCKTQMPDDLAQRIKSEESLAMLRSWIEEAACADSIEAFRKAVGL